MAIGVKVQKNNIDRALKQFREKVKNSKIIEEYRSRREYSKPSVKKRQKLLKSIQKQQFENKKNSDY